jgi:vitamin B12 transporter
MNITRSFPFVHKLLFTFCYFLLINNSQATETKTKNTDPITEVIEVVSSHLFTSVNYQLLRREDFINSAQTLSDVLKNINGIQIRQISGLGNPVSISIRGSSAKQVQMYIDGQLVNDSQFGGFDLNQIPTEQIESIEISKNQALGTGSTPIGGVIRINTFNPSESKQKMTLSAGSFGYKEVSILKNTSFKSHSLALGGNYLTSDNNYDYLVPQSFSNPSQSIKEPLKNNAFKKLSLFINDNAQIGQHQLRFNVQYNKQEKELPNYQNNSPENTSSIETERVRYGLQHYWLSSITYFDSIELTGIELDYYGEKKDEFYLDSLNETHINTNDYQSDKQHLGIKPNVNWQTLSFTPFIDINKQTFSSYSTNNGQVNQCNGISACDIKAKQTRLNYGARIEWQSTHYPLNSYLLNSQLQEKNENIALNTTNPQYSQQTDRYSTSEFGLNYGQKQLNTSINISKGIRTPTLFELFGDRGSFKGNSNLLSEEASTVTLGAQYKIKALHISSSVYYQDLDNSIVAIFNSSGVGSYTNVGRALLKGFEFQADTSITSDLSLSMQVSLIDSKTGSEFIAFDDKKLPGIYHQQYSAALLYQFTKSWRVKINNSIDKELYFNRSNQFQSSTNQIGGGNPANRNLTDLSLSWRTEKYNTTLSFNNLFNEQYQDLANRPAQGRSIQLKFSIQDI